MRRHSPTQRCYKITPLALLRPRLLRQQPPRERSPSLTAIRSTGCDAWVHACILTGRQHFYACTHAKPLRAVSIAGNRCVIDHHDKFGALTCHELATTATWEAPQRAHSRFRAFAGLNLERSIWRDARLSLNSALSTQFFINQGLKLHRRNIADLSSAFTTTDTFIAYTSLTTIRNCTLPNPATASSGAIYGVVDESGSATQSVYVNVLPNAAETIDGASSYRLNSARGTGSFLRPTGPTGDSRFRICRNRSRGTGLRSRASFGRYQR